MLQINTFPLGVKVKRSNFSILDIILDLHTWNVDFPSLETLNFIPQHFIYFLPYSLESHACAK